MTQSPATVRYRVLAWLALAAALSYLCLILCRNAVSKSVEPAGTCFFASWFPASLQETRGVSVAPSGYLQDLAFAGTLTGCIFGGMVTDWIWRRTGGLCLSRSST